MENVPQKKDESLPFVLMDRLDDELIVQELEGRLPSVLTYHFKQENQEVWGLSKAGVDEATGELSKQGEVVRELEMTFEDNEREAYFTVKAGRFAIAKDGKEVLLDTKFGTKRQPKFTPKGNSNPFWYEQGAMKAARNAAMRIIPKSIVQGVIEYAKKQNKVKEVTPNDVKSAFEEKDQKDLGETITEYMQQMEICSTLGELQIFWKSNYKKMKQLPESAYKELEAQKDHLKQKLFKE